MPRRARIQHRSLLDPVGLLCFTLQLLPPTPCAAPRFRPPPQSNSARNSWSSRHRRSREEVGIRDLALIDRLHRRPSASPAPGNGQSTNHSTPDQRSSGRSSALDHHPLGRSESTERSRVLKPSHVNLLAFKFSVPLECNACPGPVVDGRLSTTSTPHRILGVARRSAPRDESRGRVSSVLMGSVTAVPASVRTAPAAHQMHHHYEQMQCLQSSPLSSRGEARPQEQRAHKFEQELRPDPCPPFSPIVRTKSRSRIVLS